MRIMRETERGHIRMHTVQDSCSRERERERERNGREEKGKNKGK